MTILSLFLFLFLFRFFHLECIKIEHTILNNINLYSGKNVFMPEKDIRNPCFCIQVDTKTGIDLKMKETRFIVKMACFIRPTMEEISNKLVDIVNKSYFVPKINNKGKPGLFLEKLLGIPSSNECLDCIDGELKTFPVRYLKNGAISPKETISITMINNQHLLRDEFVESKCFQKIKKILFVPYCRYEDNIVFICHSKGISKAKINPLWKFKNLKESIFIWNNEDGIQINLNKEKVKTKKVNENQFVADFLKIQIIRGNNKMKNKKFIVFSIENNKLVYFHLENYVSLQ